VLVAGRELVVPLVCAGVEVEVDAIPMLGVLKEVSPDLGLVVGERHVEVDTVDADNDAGGVNLSDAEGGSMKNGYCCCYYWLDMNLVNPNY
jgi:hypothetical protein